MGCYQNWRSEILEREYRHTCETKPPPQCIRRISVNTVANEKRLNAWLESNREEIDQNEWLGVGYIHGDINTPDGLWGASLV